MKIDLAIGQIITGFDGKLYIATVTTKSNSCRGCGFKHTPDCWKYFCTSENRKDDTEIIFKEVGFVND